MQGVPSLLISLLASDWVADYLERRDWAVEFVDSLVAGFAISITPYAEACTSIHHEHDWP